jgi:hypothetical protein
MKKENSDLFSNTIEWHEEKNEKEECSSKLLPYYALLLSYGAS